MSTPTLLTRLPMRSSLFVTDCPSLSNTRFTPKTTYICHSCLKRQPQSSYRRTRKALNVKPDPAFYPSKTESKDHIIFNPPSSAPSPYHTPTKFLPASDPRRKIHTSSSGAVAAASAAGAVAPNTSRAGMETSAIKSIAAAAAAAAKTSTSLPPPIRQPYTKKYHLTPTEVDEMRTLRSSDPRKWTRQALAEKYDCSQFFVSLCCAAPKEIQEERSAQLEAVKSKWGRRKMEAREQRKVRKGLWGRDA